MDKIGICDDIKAKLMHTDGICEAFKAKLTEAFPNCYIYAKEHVIIGTKTILVRFANVLRREDAANCILENANGYMSFLIDYDPSEGYSVERPTMHYRDTSIKFRRIKGASQDVVLDKLYAWFLKNHDTILASKPSWK